MLRGDPTRGRRGGLRNPQVGGECCDSRGKCGVLYRVAAVEMEKQWMDLEDGISET